MPATDDTALEALIAKRMRGEPFTADERATLEELSRRSDDGFFNFEAGVEARVATEANGAQRMARFVAAVNTNDGPNAQAELGAAKEMGLRRARGGFGGKAETFARTSTTGEQGIAFVDEVEAQRGPFGVAVGEERGLAGNVKDKAYVEAFAHAQARVGAHEAELKAYLRAEVSNDPDTRRAVAARMALRGAEREAHDKALHAELAERRKQAEEERAAKSAASSTSRAMPWQSSLAPTPTAGSTCGCSGASASALRPGVSEAAHGDAFDGWLDRVVDAARTGCDPGAPPADPWSEADRFAPNATRERSMSPEEGQKVLAALAARDGGPPPPDDRYTTKDGYTFQMEQLPTSTGDRESVLTVVAPRSLARAGFFRAIGAVGRVLPAAPLAPTQNGFGGIRG